MSLAFTRRVLTIVKLEQEAQDCEKLRQPRTAAGKRARAQEIRDAPLVHKIRTTKQVFQDHYGRVRESSKEIVRVQVQQTKGR